MAAEQSVSALRLRASAALLLLWMAVIALGWPVPFMAWDHLDLVPMLQALREGGLGPASPAALPCCRSPCC
jgi:hypothetical protein